MGPPARVGDGDMSRHQAVDKLSVEEIRRILAEKRKAERQVRLEHFRRTGRLVTVEPAPPTSQPVDSLRTRPLDEINAQHPPRKESKGVNRILLVVEVLAVLGLGFILLNGFSLLKDLNREVAAAMRQPSVTPTPLITAVVLPSGHTPPNSPGGAQPNEAEIPEHLRPLVQSLANLPVPTLAPENAVRIQIPAINVDAPVVLGDGWEQLKKGVGQRLGSPNPGLSGNLVLSAHNDIFGEIFRELERLKPGDQVIISTSMRAYTYVISSTQIVEPTQVDVLAPTERPTLTLISCYPYLVDNQRIVVFADLQGQP
jgi:sortase A